MAETETEDDAGPNIGVEAETKSEIEEWRTPDGYAPYQVSSLGRLRGKKGLPIAGALNHQGYCISCLHLPEGNKMTYHHRLVARAFIPNPDSKPHVNHRDGNRANNRVTNLEWVTIKENMACKVFPNPSREMKNCRRQVEQLSMDGEVLCVWESQSAPAEHYGITSANINACCIGRQKSAAGYRWRNVDKPAIEDLAGEEWKELEYKKYKYKVSNKGRVILKTGGVTIGSERAGYLYCGGSHPVHRLVATAFLPNPASKEFVNHIDGNGLNNDVTNLEWATPKENSRHAVETGLIKGEGGYKRPVEQYDLNDTLIATYPSIAEASRAVKCNAANIGSACVGRHYRTVGGFKWKYGKIQPTELPAEDTPVINPNKPKNSSPDYVETKVVISVVPPAEVLPAKPKPHGKWRPVSQFTLDGVFVATYPSLAEAARQTGIDSRGISANCVGTNASSKGFVWKFDEATRLAAIRPIPLGHHKIVVAPVDKPPMPPETRVRPIAATSEQNKPIVVPDDDPIWTELGL